MLFTFGVMILRIILHLEGCFFVLQLSEIYLFHGEV